MEERRQNFEDLKSGKKKDTGKKGANSKLAKALNKKKPAAKPKPEPLDKMFEMPEAQLLEIIEESYENLNSTQNAPSFTPEAKKHALRDQKMARQLSSISTEQIEAISPKLRSSLAHWFSTYTNMRYTSFMMSGTKSVDVKRDHEIVWKLLDMPEDKLESFSVSDRRTNTLVSLDAANHLEDKPRLLQCFNELTTTPVDEAMLPQIESLGFKSGLSVDEVIMLFPIAAFLGKWDWVRRLGDDLTKIDGALDNFRATSKRMITIPDMLTLYRFATVYNPDNEMDAPEVLPVDTEVKTTYGVGKVVEYRSEDDMYKIELTQWYLSEGAPVFVFSQRSQFTVAPPSKLMSDWTEENPHPYTQVAVDEDALNWTEYHIRSARLVLDFDKCASADPAYLRNLRIKTEATEVPARMFSPGERKILIRGAVAQMRSFAPRESQVVGPCTDSDTFVFAGEDVLSNVHEVVVQHEEYYFTRGEEDVHGKSTWDGYMRLKQMPSSTKNFTFNFYFKISMVVHRVLSDEEKAISDRVLAEEALAEKEKLAAAAAEAEAAEAAAAAEAANKNVDDIDGETVAAEEPEVKAEEVEASEEVAAAEPVAEEAVEASEEVAAAEEPVVEAEAPVEEAAPEAEAEEVVAEAVEEPVEAEADESQDAEEEVVANAAEIVSAEAEAPESDIPADE